MQKASRKRQYEDEPTSSAKSTRRCFEDESSSQLSGDLVEVAGNQSIRGFLIRDQRSKYEYDPKKEGQFISLVEHVDWMHNNSEQMIDYLDYPESTFELLNREKQYNFVEKDIYDDVRKCKTALDQFDKDTLRTAKSSSNPFELINKCIFQNRSALKMANLDYLCNYMFTSPKPPLIDESKDILYFADICGGPGGFTEYVLWKRKWEARGFGITLKAENDFNLEKLPSTSIFSRFYGDLEDGDICNPKNLLSFRNFVLNNTTDKHGVHFAVADGGFSCQGKESLQEQLLKRLILCQFVCSLSILRKGGNFMCKVFDVYSEFVVGLIYLMYRCFKQFAIIKPNTSRPANSERYIVFKHKLDNCEYIENFLFKINCSLDSFELAASSESSPNTLKEDFHQLVSLDMIKADSAFFNYICQSNNSLGRRQIHFLCKERAFASDPTLVDGRKTSLRRKCLSEWKIPTRIQSNSTMNNMTAEVKFEHLMSQHSINISKCAFLYYDLHEMKQLNMIKYPWNFYFTTLTENRDNDSQRGIYLSFKNTIFFFDTNSNQWKLVRMDKLKLPDDTLVYGELTSEYKGEGSSQKKVNAFHIVDCCILGGVNVCGRPLEERIEMGEKMLKALSLQNASNFFIRVKKYYSLPTVEDYFQELEMKECKGIRKERMCLKMNDENFCIASGLLICSKLKSPFGSNKSNSTMKLYYFNYKSSHSTSVFKCPSEGIKDFVTNYTERYCWRWHSNLDLLPPDDTPSINQVGINNKITRQSINRYMNQILKKPK